MEWAELPTVTGPEEEITPRFDQRLRQAVIWSSHQQADIDGVKGKDVEKTPNLTGNLTYS